MSLPGVSLCAIIALLPLIWLPELPGHLPVTITTVVASVMLLYRHHGVRYAGATLLFFAWGVVAARMVIWPTQMPAPVIKNAQVTITATDNESRHEAVITHSNGRRLFPAPGVVLYGRLPQQVCAGQRWGMKLKIRPVHGQLNEGGFDLQRDAVVRRRVISGRVSGASLLAADCSARARYLASLTARLAPRPWREVLLALAMGERAAVSPQIKRVMRETGTAHLMAISGLHIGLAASLAWLIVRGGQFFLPGRWINGTAPLLGGIIAGTLYAWLTGLQPPALRTVMALSVWGALRLSARRWSPWQTWQCCVAAILVADPMSILSQSLWLSAFAVAGLIFWYQWLPLSCHGLPGLARPLVKLLHLQAGMMALLLPLQVVVFHGISLSSLLANLFAVPVVTLLSVPLILVGMILHLTGPVGVESGVWYLADRSLALIFYLLQRLPDGWIDTDRRWQWLAFAPWLAVIIWRLRLWRDWPALCLSLLALLSFPLWRHSRADGWSLHMLDVGQGLALVIERNGKALLYDTGRAWPGGDSGQQVIVPWLRWRHLHPQGIILSHEHLDHRGGLETLQKTWPQLWVRSPLGWAGHQPCLRGENWNWQGLTFSVHWPLRESPRGGNDGSCVVKVGDGYHSVLLTGDIEAPGEQKLVRHEGRHLQAALLQVPHHGSNSSSTLPLLRRVNGSVALASVARYNPWRMPSDKVMHRYRQQGYQWLDTAHQGQISVHFSHHGWRIRSLREQILPRWYHQWFGVSADNG